MAPATRASARATRSKTKSNPVPKPTVQPTCARPRRKLTAKVPPQEEQSAASSKNRHIPSDDETETQPEDVEPADDKSHPLLDEDDANFNLANRNETAPNEEDLVVDPSGEDEPNAEASNPTDTTPIDRCPKPRLRDKNAAKPQKDPFDLSGRWEKHRDEQRMRLSKRQLYLTNPLSGFKTTMKMKTTTTATFKTRVGPIPVALPPPPFCLGALPAIGALVIPTPFSSRSERSSPPRAHSVSAASAARGRGRSPRRPQRPSLSPPPAVTPSRPRGRLIAADPLRPVPNESDDDYHAHQEAKRKSKQYKVDRGHSHSHNTENEDKEENLDFDIEIKEQVLEDEEPTPKSKKSAPKKTRLPTAKATSSKAAPSKSKAAPSKSKSAPSKEGKEKGKSKAQELEAESGSEDDDEEDEEEEEEEDEGNDVSPNGGYKKGPIPEKIKKKVHGLYAQLIDDVKALAVECGKPTTSLYRELDLIGKALRATSVWNLWQRYFSKQATAAEKKGVCPLTPYFRNTDE
ncbi:hypothetical protein K438DRAFT_1969094 [Mycena galopus ATCC 62051]|nr:hypothetical protein K438DRAFT_1969094 [Mycena galopus ATCC 62051]